MTMTLAAPLVEFPSIRRPKWARTLRPDCRLTLTIDGRPYQVRPFEDPPEGLKSRSYSDHVAMLKGPTGGWFVVYEKAGTVTADGIEPGPYCCGRCGDDYFCRHALALERFGIL